MSVCTSYFRFFIVSFALICLVKAQIPSLGGCPANIEAIDDFDAAKYLGKWYEYEKYPFTFELGGKCIYAIYGETSNSSVVSVVNTQIGFFSKTKRTNITGTATLTEGPNIGKLLVKFNKVPVTPKSANYWVLGTDYTSYAVVYSCSDFKLFHTTVVWVLTRDRIPSSETLSEAREVINANNISRTWFIKTKQSDCPTDEH